jgi:hypothetical protein
MTEQKQPTRAEETLTMILLVMREVLAELQKKPNKGKRRVKQGSLWGKTEPRIEKPYDRAGKEWEASRRQNEAELAAEREVKHGVVVSPVARSIADKMIAKSNGVLRKEQA